MTVDALLGRGHFEDRVDIEFLLFVDQAVDLYLPGAGAEILGELGGFVFVGGEFVIIVVVGDVFVGSDGLGGAERAFLDAVDLVARERNRRRRDDLAQAHAGGRCGSGDAPRRPETCGGSDTNFWE